MNESYEPRPEDQQEQPVYTPYHTPEQPPKKEKKQRTGLKLVALALCCSLLGGIVGAGGVVLTQNLMAPEEAAPASTTILVGDREVQPIDLATIDTGKLLTPAEVYAQNVNSTVGITTSITTNFWGYTTTSAVSGSGFILTEDGYILTNHHVIQGSNAITVTLYDGTTYDAQLIGYDESLDTAVLKVEAENLVPVVLGDSDALNVGDSVIAIGNPLGELTFSLTAGAVSALDREVTLSTTTMDLIQTDCAINSGNSGGALFNLYGEVIGITNAKYSSSSMSEASIDNIGFAIPINDAMYIVKSIIENGYIAKPYIGVSIMDVSAETQSYGLPKGAAVKEIVEGSPAETAGLQINDIITKADDTEITGSNDLVDYIGARSVGDTVKLAVYRQGQTLEITLEIGEQIKSALANEETGAEQSQPQPLPQQGGISGFPFFGFGG